MLISGPACAFGDINPLIAIAQELKRVGLTSITVGIETPNEETLRNYKRAPIKDDRQREFVVLCRNVHDVNVVDDDDHNDRRHHHDHLDSAS